MVAFGVGEDFRDHLESGVCTLPLTLGRQIWIWIWICQLTRAASDSPDCQPAAAATLTTNTRASTRGRSHSPTPFSDVHPTLWTLLQVKGREPPPLSTAPCHRISRCPPPAHPPTICPPRSFLLHEAKSCAHSAARTDPEVSLARGHRTTVAGGNRSQSHQVLILILSLSRRRCLCPSRQISISGPAPLPQISGVSSACPRQSLFWRHCRLCLDPRRRTRAAKRLQLQLQLQLCLRLHLQLHSHSHLHLLHLRLQLQPQLAAKRHRGRGPGRGRGQPHQHQQQHPHYEQALLLPPLIASGDLTPHRLIRRQVTGAGTDAGPDRGTGTTVPAFNTYPPRPSAVKAVSAAPHPFQRLLTLPSEIIVDQLNSPP